MLRPREAGPCWWKIVCHRDQARRAAVRPPAARMRDRDAAAAAVGVLGVAEIDGAIFCEIAAEHHVHQAGLALRVDLRHAGERRRQFAAARDDAHAAGPLGHQHAAVGQKGERPGMHQAAGDGLDFEFAGGGGENLRRRPRRATAAAARPPATEDRRMPVSIGPASTMRDRGGFRQALGD